MAAELVCGLGLRAPHLVINFNACNFLILTVTKYREVGAFQIDAFSAQGNKRNKNPYLPFTVERI